MEVVEWMDEGRVGVKPRDFLVELCERLVRAGAPLWRLRCGFRTLHPQFTAWGLTWMRGSDAAEQFIEHGLEKTNQYIGSPAQLVNESGKMLRRNLAQLGEADHLVLHELAAQGATDYLALPLRFSDGKFHTLMLATDGKAGFSGHDVAQFTVLARFLSPVLEVMSTRRMARALLDTYVGPRSGKKILNGAVRRGDSELIHAALWFSDLRDFTRLTETLETGELLATLNEYFEFVTEAVTARGGEVLRFIGDAMLIVFPVGAGRDSGEACAAALDSALDATAALARVNRERRKRGQVEINFGVGLHTGEVVYGNVGAPTRLDYTVMGPAVNLTARLEGLTKIAGESILFSRAFADRLRRKVESRGFHALKGVAREYEALCLAK